MANGDTPPVSLMDRQGMDLDLDDVQAVEVEALPGDIATRVEIEGVEIVQEDDGGATLDFDPFRNRDREDDFYDNLAEFLPDWCFPKFRTSSWINTARTVRRGRIGRTRTPRALSFWASTTKSVQSLFGALRV